VRGIAIPATLVAWLVSGSAPPEEGRCPFDMIAIDDGFCIDPYEAALEAISPDGTPTSWSPYASPKDEAIYRAISKRLQIPQAYISQRAAKAACERSGKRLCRDEEWSRACRGEVKTQYPYGEIRRVGYCNDAAREPLAAVRAADGRTLFETGKLDDPRLNQVDRTIAPAGLFSRCRSEAPVFDMVGNLHEWTDDPQGTMRGGFYLDTTKLGEGCGYKAVGHNDLYADYSTGFRCCRDQRK
jgi:formylglycine-generating enzyme